MLVSLIKKDFLLVKKYLWAMLAVTVATPLFLRWQVPEAVAIVGQLFMPGYVVFLLTQYNFLKEYQYPKATALLCALPYSRRLMVLSKYCCCMIFFAGSNLVYFAETLIFPELGSFSIELAAVALLVVSVVAGVYFVVQYQFGYEKTRLIPPALIVLSPMLAQRLPEPVSGMDFGFLTAAPPYILTGAVMAAGVAFFAVSFFICSRIYEKKELT